MIYDDVLFVGGIFKTENICSRDTFNIFNALENKVRASQAAEKNCSFLLQRSEHMLTNFSSLF